MKAPIFIIGCPRSGTTVLLRIMCMHEQVSWISNYVNRFPRITGLTALNRIYDFPAIGKQLYLLSVAKRPIQKPPQVIKVLPTPVEPWAFWGKHLLHFRWPRDAGTPARKRTAHDMKSHESYAIRKTINSIMRWQGRGHFISKYTDFPRIRYLSKAFPDSKFIHVVRDGRAVARSYRKKIDSNAWKNTWAQRNWWINGWRSEWQSEWSRCLDKVLGFAAFQWKYFVGEILKDAEGLASDRYIEVLYRDFVGSPSDTIEHVLAFSSLRSSDRIKWLLDHMQIRDMNEKWKVELSDGEIRMLDNVFWEPELSKFLEN
jgi:hypothetical protein